MKKARNSLKKKKKDSFWAGFIKSCHFERPDILLLPNHVSKIWHRRLLRISRARTCNAMATGDRDNHGSKVCSLRNKDKEVPQTNTEAGLHINRV